MSDITTGMVFGTFDRLHDGHKYFLAQAQQQCVKLIIVVAQDAVIYKLKGHYPRESLQERMNAVNAIYKGNRNVVPGDATLEQWGPITTYKPNVIFLGYDQESLHNALRGLLKQHHEAYPDKLPLFTIVSIEAFKPQQYKSSILNSH